MHDLSEINPHLALAQSESYVGPGAWERFVARVERLIGHDLDGDQERDGYSLDYAHDAFMAGVTADEHALGVKAAIIAKAVA